MQQGGKKSKEQADQRNYEIRPKLIVKFTKEVTIHTQYNK